MTSSTLYSQTLSTLVATRTTMLSPNWIASLDNASADDRLQASLQLVKVQQAIAALSNAALSDISDQMDAQADDIKTATANLTKALKSIANVQKVIDAVTSLLTTVAKIVPLI